MTTVKNQIKSKDSSSNITKLFFNELLPALKKLDELLKKAVDAAQTLHGSKTAADPFRGLYISDGEVENLLNREPVNLSLKSVGKQSDESVSRFFANGSRMSLLQQAFKLSPFELDLILIALSSEIDQRYEKLYAYLQDDVTRKRPTVDLSLNLLCALPDEKLARRDHFAPNAPLTRQNLLHLIPDPSHTEPPLLSHYLKLDDQIVSFLLGQDGLDTRLAPFCELIKAKVSFYDVPLSDEVKQALPVIANLARAENQTLKLYFQGPSGIGKRMAAGAMAKEIGAPLLVANLGRISESNTIFDQTINILFREAWLHNAVLILDRVDLLFNSDRANQYGHLLEALAKDRGIIILTGTKPWVPSGRGPTGVITVKFELPDFTQLKSHWRAGLHAAGISLNGNHLDVLAGRFRLTPGQVSEAISVADNQARWRMANESAVNSTFRVNSQPTLGELLSAARAQSGHDLERLAHKIDPHYTWADIVLPEDTIMQLHEICQRVVHRHQVLGEWGFGRKLSLGKGVNALFEGLSGTGKTMAAEIVANDLGLDLYKIDLSSVISKYIGETEKNLASIFRVAENANAILLFDEADALFGKRSEVHDSHDRYANIEISYLLQKMEEYEGLSILSTNLRQNMDDAFVRRMAFAVNFPFPDRASRRRIWECIWPADVPLAEEVDLEYLAHQFKLAGGNIKNIALAAAYLSIDSVGAIKMTHLLQATQREYQKLGKVLSEAEIKGSIVKQQSATNHSDGKHTRGLR